MNYKRFLLNGIQMKAIDTYSIREAGIPSLVLMERAALAVSDVITRIAGMDKRIICVCSVGNNGADGLCVSRIMKLRGYDTAMCITGDPEKATEEFQTQLAICRNLKVPQVNITSLGEYDVIVDALFGIGLRREITGIFRDAVEAVNSAEGCVISVDMPSGINPENGQIMGCAVRAQHTVTFGYEKTGLALFPGRSHAGIVHLAEDVGFVTDPVKTMSCAWTFRTDSYRELLPQRFAASNKGTYGRVLVAAGSENMGGAPYFSACAAYKTGAGLVRVLTHENNRNVIINLLPEAVMSFYDHMEEGTLLEEFKWADVIAAGPGLSMNKKAVWLVETLLSEKVEKREGKAVLDADALNIAAAYGMKKQLRGCVITPHIGEMSRLTGMPAADIKKDIVKTAVSFAAEYECICVLKDAATVVSDGRDIYVNTSGNNGMSTAGSGDVLTGIIAGLMAQHMKPYEAACLGVWLHGLSGDLAAEKHGVCSMTASDMLMEIEKTLIG